MFKFTVQLTDVEMKALLTEMKDVQEWLDNAIHNRARVAINKIVNDTSDKQVSKLSVLERENIVKLTNVKTAVEKETEFLSSLNKS